ncbi:MAG: anthranilate phosphoribosyltransferase [Myxococcota bacterium]
MNPILDQLCAGEHLDAAQTHQIFSRLMAGELNAPQIAGLLIALKAKGETPEEIAGAASALREAATPFERPDTLFADTCGTGGDGQHTVNISTAVAFVAAAMGIPVAKHGNRSVSSKCGSADVLEACGVRLDPTPEVARRCLDEAGVCFLFAPRYHAGVRHAMPVRRALGTRTMFNLLGPLANPAKPPVQIMGVYDPALCAPLARTLGLLGCRAALVVHGSGLDELAIHGETAAALWRDGLVTELTLCPEEAGLERYPLEALRGGEPHENAAWLERTLCGDGAPAHKAAIALNAGALAMISGRAETLGDGVAAAMEVLGTDAGLEILRRLVEVSHERA